MVSEVSLVALPSIAPPNLTQVELNTIASSFGCMSALTGLMHRHLLGRFVGDESQAGDTVRSHAAALGIDVTTVSPQKVAQLIPENPTLTALPRALAAAHRCYGKDSAVVLFVVQPGDTNAVDQRLLEIKLWDDHGVRVVRMSLAEVRVCPFVCRKSVTHRNVCCQMEWNGRCFL